MKIVISDYPDSMMPSHDYEKQVLNAGLNNPEIIVFPYNDSKKEEFYSIIKDADAILTAFIHIDKEVMDNAPELKVISINATGYDNVDLKEATKRGIGVCPVGEYCTQDVAEMTIAYMMALNKGLKHYIKDIDDKGIWSYSTIKPQNRIEDQVLGIFGFGKIGKCVAKKAQGLGMRVIAYDPRVDKSVGKELHVELLSKDDVLSQADVITNHMNLNSSNVKFFSIKEFSAMKKHPIFLNMGRGLCVDEDALAEALDKGYVRAAGLDILSDETPDLKHHPLTHRENVIITPHAAFYSTASINELQRISCDNIVYYLKGEKNKVFKLVN